MKKIIIMSFICGFIFANNVSAQFRLKNCDINLGPNAPVYNANNPVPIKMLAQQRGTTCGPIKWQTAFIKRITVAAIAQSPGTFAQVVFNQGATEQKEFDDLESFNESRQTVDLLDLSIRTFDVNQYVPANSILQVRPNAPIKVFAIRLVIQENNQPAPGPGFPPGPPAPPTNQLQWIPLDGSVVCSNSLGQFSIPQNLHKIVAVQVRYSRASGANVWVQDVKLFANQCFQRNPDGSCEAINGYNRNSMGPTQRLEFEFHPNTHNMPTQVQVSCSGENGSFVNKEVQVMVKGY